MNSNPAQQEAICHKDGPMLVLAGPGSGKTYVITNRVRHLIEEHHVPPQEILVITFSRAAAGEMKERFDSLTEEKYPGVTFGTFHACFFHILQHARGYRADAIIREQEAVTLVGGLLAELRPEYAEDRPLVREIYEEILKLKCQNISSTSVELSKYIPSSCDRDTFRRVFTQYGEALRRRRKLDFEDMLLLTKELLTEDPQALAFWRARYRYLLVDEFQDVNRLQYEIVCLLAGNGGNLFAVGDDDQSIYAFRGSDPTIMLHFPEDHPGCRVIALPVNYRSTAAIIDAADALISRNRLRYSKQHTPAREPGQPPRILLCPTVAEEDALLMNEIVALEKAGCPLTEIAVLFRTNLQMRSLCASFGKASIPFHIRGFLPSLYDNPLVQTVLSYLRAAYGDRSRATILAIANRPTRYLERRLLTESEVDLDRLRERAKNEGKDYLARNIDHLIYDLSMLSRMNPFAAVHYIRKVIGLDAHILSESPRGEDAIDVLEELEETAKAHATIPLFLAAAENDKNEASRRAETRIRENGAEGVALMTFHASKGLEFRHVYICDCNETIVPHKKALLPETIEEERRLFYVAMTRAKDALTLLYVSKRFGKALPPSEFLGEVLLPIDRLAPGTAVTHRQFGDGTVVALEGDRLKIRFDRFLLPKTLSLALCARSQLLTIKAPKES